MAGPERPTERSLSSTLDDFGQTPLFMQDLPDQDNDQLEAIRALQYEGTPYENAKNFKTQGNELVAVRQWRDAREMYTKALAILTHEPSPRSEEMDKLEELCYINRALCQLRLENYRSTTLDCAAAIRLDSGNVKAYFRSAEALFALGKWPEAADACRRGLTIDPANAALENTHSKVLDKLHQAEKLELQKRNKELKKREEESLLKTALKARGIKTLDRGRPPDMEDARIHLAPDPSSPVSALHFPVVLLYPRDGQSDFVKAFAETDTLAVHLSYIFPLPWDTHQRYSESSVDCFIETASKGLIKIGRNATLLRIMTSSDIVVINQLVSINVVPHADSADWVAEMKRRVT